jgi:hypothetical protein
MQKNSIIAISKYDLNQVAGGCNIANICLVGVVIALIIVIKMNLAISPIFKYEIDPLENDKQ